MTDAMPTAVVVFTRDLRRHDNRALHLACSRARQVVPLFVHDPGIPAPPNRSRFLAESLADLRGEYVRRYVPELSALPPSRIHTPWRLDSGARGYPGPLIEVT